MYDWLSGQPENQEKSKFYWDSTVSPEIFAQTLFLQIVLKDI